VFSRDPEDLPRHEPACPHDSTNDAEFQRRIEEWERTLPLPSRSPPYVVTTEDA
jgi:hypothetical protein